MPAVSIVTPAKIDSERSLGWLNECVESVLKQNVKDWEMIIVNDHSEQSWRPIADIFKDDRITGMKPKHDEASVSRSRNQAVRRATSKLILPLDADDKLPENSVKRFLKAWNDKGSKKGIVYSDVLMFDTDVSRLYRPIEYSFDTMLKATFMIVGCLHRKSDWARAEGWNPQLDSGLEDWEYWIRMGELGVCGHYCKETLYHYRRHAYGRIAMLRSTPTRYDMAYQRMRRMHQETYNGRRPMGCCGGPAPRSTPLKSAAAAMMGADGGPAANKAYPATINAPVKMIYIGGRAGSFGMRGISGKRYRVPGKNKEFPIEAMDVEYFKRYNHGRDFVEAGRVQ